MDTSQKDKKMKTKTRILTAMLWFGAASYGLTAPPAEDSTSINRSDSTIQQSTSLVTSREPSKSKAGEAPLFIDRSTSIEGGTFVKVSWTPSAAVGAFVVISEEEVVVGYDESGFLTTSVPCVHKTHRQADETPEVVFPNLDPDRKYFYAILPMNDSNLGNGLVIPHYRTTKTMQRHVYIKVTKLEVIDDSDDLSDGEMAFTFQLLPSELHPKEAEIADFFDAIRWPELSGNEGAGEGYLNVCSGASLNPSVDLYASNVGDSIRLAVSAFDDDVSGVYDVSAMPEAFEYTGAFNEHFGEANAGFWTLDIDGGTYETDTDEPDDYMHMEQFEYNLSANVPENDITCLEFKVHFTVSVYYSAP
jgi:hypothetical protein